MRHIRKNSTCRPRSSIHCAQAASLPSLEEDYRSAVVRAVLSAVLLFSTRGRRPAGRRQIINFLRGNQIPRPSAGVTPADDGFGILEDHGAAWIGGILDHLTEKGYLVLEPRQGNLPPGISLGASGRVILSGGRSLPQEAYPSRPRLGACPPLEERLRALRRDLARSEGRVPFGIFPNSVLASLVSSQPKDMAELAGVPGLGEARIRKYGRRILSALRC